jgi:hypothetical protein
LVTTAALTWFFSIVDLATQAFNQYCANATNKRQDNRPLFSPFQEKNWWKQFAALAANDP